MGLPKRIRGLRTTCLVLFNFFHATLSDSPNHSHANPKIVYVSPFSSEARIQQAASARQENSVYPLPGTASSYSTNQLPLINHDYSHAPIVEDPKYALPNSLEEPFNVHVQSPGHVDEPLNIHIDVPTGQLGAYAGPAFDAYQQPVLDVQEVHEVLAADDFNVHVQSPTHVDETLHIHVEVPTEAPLIPQLAVYEAEPPEQVAPPAPPAPTLGILQLLPLFVITVLAVIASTIVGALLG